MFAHKYTYCAVTFDGRKSYWYRTNDRCYRVGDRVIVPVSNNCKRKQGIITKIEKCTAKKAPLPLDKTKGIVGKVGLFGEAKIKKHNYALQKCKAGVLDISTVAVNTKKGCTEVITTAEERKHFRRDKAVKRFFIVETFPPAVHEQVAGRTKKEAEKLGRLTNDYAWIDEAAAIEAMTADPWNDK